MLGAHLLQRLLHECLNFKTMAASARLQHSLAKHWQGAAICSVLQHLLSQKSGDPAGWLRYVGRSLARALATMCSTSWGCACTTASSR